MKIRIAVAGCLMDQKQLFGKVDMIVGQIIAHMSVQSGKADVQLIVSDLYTSETWMLWNEAHSFEVLSINGDKSSAFLQNSDLSVIKETSVRGVCCEEMCSRADIAIAVWNEDPSEHAGATWEFFKDAYERKLPCIWISSKTNQEYCLWDSYYEKYSPKYLKEVLLPLPDAALTPLQCEGEKDTAPAFWEKRRKNFLKRFKADHPVHEPVEDSMLDPDYVMAEPFSQGEAVRRELLDRFKAFDSAAIKYNGRFQAMLYQRSVLPFITTIFLAVGFYAETLVGKTLSPVLGAAWITTFAAILAGIGFLIHACLNLYVYRLSKSRQVSEWQECFIKNRYTAELLRIMIHLLPYGVHPDLRRICSSEKALCAKLMHFGDEIELQQVKTSRETVRDMMQHLRELILDQLSYHEASQKRYESVITHLKKWGQVILYIGFVMVLIRGLLQYILVLYPISTESIFDLNSITRSFLNMLALVLPAWAGYFSTKAQINNFNYNYNNHTQMKNRLQKVLKRVERILEQEHISVEASNKISEELAEILIHEDIAAWEHQYMNSSIKPL